MQLGLQSESSERRSRRGLRELASFERAPADTSDGRRGDGGAALAAHATCYTAGIPGSLDGRRSSVPRMRDWWGLPVWGLGSPVS